MELFITFVFNCIMIVTAVLWCVVPSFSRAGIFFGVTVDPTFRETPDARRIVSKYRRTIGMMAGVSTLGLWLSTPYLAGLNWIWALMGALSVQVGGAVASAARANKQVSAFARPQRLTRTASLRRSTRRLPGGWALFLGPLLIVAVAAIMVFAWRDLMPPETFRGAMSLVLVAVVADVLFLWLGYFSIFRTRQVHGIHASDNEERALRRINYLVMLLMPYLLTVFNVYLALSSAKIVPSSGRIVALAIVSWIVLAGLGVTALLRAAKRRAAVMESEGVVGDSTMDVCWKLGIVYYNPDDPAFIVPKRIGFGWDMNFGNKWSWVLAVSLVALPFVIRFFWFM